MDSYQWWWEAKREGLCDWETWTMKVCGRSDEVESVRGIITPRQRKRKIEETEEMAMRANEFVFFFVCFRSFLDKLETPLKCLIPLSL